MFFSPSRKVRAAIADRLKDRVDDVTETVANKYEDAVGRLESAAACFAGQKLLALKSDWLFAGRRSWSGIGNTVGAGSRERDAPGCPR